MALESFEIIEGGSLELSLPTGHQLRADWVAAGVTQTETITAAADTATFTPAATGCFYLAIREDTADNWCRYGSLEVIPLVDLDHERMKTELALVNDRISTAQDSLIQFQFTDPSGTAATRMKISELVRTRASLEARLANYERALRGDPPVRFS